MKAPLFGCCWGGRRLGVHTYLNTHQGGGKEDMTLARCASGGVVHYEGKRLRYDSSIIDVVASSCKKRRGNRILRGLLDGAHRRDACKRCPKQFYDCRVMFLFYGSIHTAPYLQRIYQYAALPPLLCLLCVFWRCGSILREQRWEYIKLRFFVFFGSGLGFPTRNHIFSPFFSLCSVDEETFPSRRTCCVLEARRANRVSLS